MDSSVALQNLQGVVHDLRHLIQAIVSSTDTLELALEDRNLNWGKQLLSRLKHSVAEAVKMLSDLRVNPPQSGLGRPQASVSLALHRVLTSLTSLVEEKAAQVQVKCKSDVLACLSEIDLDRLLLNLLTNALEAADSRTPHITIAAAVVSPDWVRISVLDNGRGMPASQVHNLCQDLQITNSGEGAAGLGMRVVQSILRANCGYFDIASKPGTGTEVVIWLPRRAN